MQSSVPDQLMKLVAEYSERFGQLVPRSALESIPEPELIKMLQDALAKDEAVAAWTGQPFGSRQPLPDNGPDSETRGWRQHNLGGALRNKPRG